MRLPVKTVIHTTLVGLEPATFRLLVDCWSDAIPVVPPTHLHPRFTSLRILRSCIKTVQYEYSLLLYPSLLQLTRLGQLARGGYPVRGMQSYETPVPLGPSASALLTATPLSAH